MIRCVMWFVIVVGLIALSCNAVAQDALVRPVKPPPARYDHHKLIRVHPRTQRELDALIAAGARPLNCITGFGGPPLECSVSPEALVRLKNKSVKFEVLNEDIGPIIDAQVARMQAQALQKDGGIAGPNWFADFKTYPQVNAYIDTLVALRPDLISKIAVGNTLEGRTMYAMRISGPPGGAPGTKPAVIFNGCQHAREWIAVMVPMYIADALVRRYDIDPSIKSIVDRVEFFIIPITNPDGYEFTYAPGGDRLWRKNRRDIGGTIYGVDLNRNWSVAWNGGQSNSNDPNSDVYVGAGAFSEPETQIVRTFVINHPQIKAHIDFHSYSQLILQNWGYTNAASPDIDLIDAIGTDMNQSIFATHGVNYFNGWGGSLLYLASGVFPDWCYGDRGFLGYTIELRDTGFYHFVLPADQIIPNSEEALPAALKLADWTTRGAAFLFPRGTPTSVVAGDTTNVTVNVPPVAGTSIVVGSSKLFTRIGAAGPFASTTMTGIGSTFFTALPAVSCGHVIQYYFSIQTANGITVTSPAGAPANYYQAVASNTALSYNFETAAGWTVQNGASAGARARGTPINDPNWPYDPTADADGSGQCFVTQNAAGQTSVHNGVMRLFSPDFNLAAVAASGRALISYSYFLHLTTPGANDPLVVEISSNGAAGPWTEIIRHTTSGGAMWRTNTIMQAQLQLLGVSLTTAMRLRFSISDGAPTSIVEAGIDAVRISNDCNGPPPCIADITPSGPGGVGDGKVNIDDLLVVINAWGQCPPPCPPHCAADIIQTGAGSCQVNIDDLLAVINAWGVCL